VQSGTEIRSLIWARADQQLAERESSNLVINQVSIDFNGDMARPPCCRELLSNLVFEVCLSCGDLVRVCGFNSVFERDACDDFGKVVKAA
jgi:hypothetical protein